MREINEDEVYALAGDSECPVLRKEESAEMEAAVCLKRFPQGYVLGVSDKVKDLRLWFIPELAEAEAQYQRFAELMRAHGTPFGSSA